MKYRFYCVLAVMLVTGFLISCASPGAGRLSFTAGTYTATVIGHQGPLTVETTFTGNSIASVRVVRHIESAGVWQMIDVIPQRIVEQQSLAVDVVAGATVTSFAIIQAVTESVREAGGDVALMSRPVRAPRVRNQRFEADVIIIGAGGAGLSAAVSAHQSGASVIVLERLGIAGGNTVFSDGALNAPNPVAQANITMTDDHRRGIEAMIARTPRSDFEAELITAVSRQFAEFTAANRPGLFDSAEWHMWQTYSGADYVGVPALIRTLGANASDGVRWMAELGAPWRPNLGAATGSLWQRSHYGTAEFPNGLHSLIPFVNYIGRNDNIDIHFNTNAVSLITQGGRVTGVRATYRGATITYTARYGVIMATGGFGANVEMRAYHNAQWEYLGPGIGTTNHQMVSTGDGIIMGQAVGAQLRDMGYIQVHPSGEVGTGMMNLHPGTAGNNRIFVNMQGLRFVAEDARRDIMINAIQDEGGMMWVVAGRERYEPDDPLIVIQVEIGKAIMAYTLEELAVLMEVPPANLRAAVDQYNAIFDGVPCPFGLRNYVDRMLRGPFYAARRIPSVHYTMGGLLIDEYTRVLDANNNPIPGFYAAGEVTGGIHGTNRLGGNALTDNIVFGRIAGQSAVARR